jgi:hypothetical protein
MFNLAASYNNQAKFVEAEILLKRCLNKMIKVFGKTDQNTLETVNALSYALINQGKHAEAQLLLKQY